MHLHMYKRALACGDAHTPASSAKTTAGLMVSSLVTAGARRPVTIKEVTPLHSTLDPHRSADVSAEFKICFQSFPPLRDKMRIF